MVDVWRVDASAPARQLIQAAAQRLREGGLVVFPTETVYGLGAHALNPLAVRRVFSLKGRPSSNPLIVHVATFEQARELTADWPAAAERLARRFWPGPLTLVLTKRPHVPPEVTAGGPTVGVRIPSHPVALALLQEAAVPVAAPSANRSAEISPTRAEHVLRSLGNKADFLLLDAGPCPGGVESTVLDMTASPPRLLRPGLITLPMLQEVIGPVAVGPSHTMQEPLRSPGLMPRHYAPHTPLYLIPQQQLETERQRCEREGLRCGIVRLPDDPVCAAAVLYDELHRLDATGYDLLLAPLLPETDEWQAVRDRLARAAHR